jgi:hypothetical protein
MKKYPEKSFTYCQAHVIIVRKNHLQGAGQMILARRALRRYLEINKGPDALPEDFTPQSKQRYFLNDPPVRLYEFLRDVQLNGLSIIAAARRHHFSERTYREKMGPFLQGGLLSLIKFDEIISIPPQVEHTVITLKRHYPKITHLGILRFLQRTEMDDRFTVGTISNILASHGLTKTEWEHFNFIEFQQLLRSMVRMKNKGLPFKRDGHVFLDPADIYQRRLEMLRKAACTKAGSVTSICEHYSISRMGFYNLYGKFVNYGLLGVFDKAGGMIENIKMTPSAEVDIVFKKLQQPSLGVQKITASLKNVKKTTVHRVLQLWGLSNYKGPSILLDDLIAALATPEAMVVEQPEELPINKEFMELLNNLPKDGIQICNPGALLMANFIHELAIVPSILTHLESYDNSYSLYNLILLNVNRIVCGLKTISRLEYAKDLSIALASGLANVPGKSTVFTRFSQSRFKPLLELRQDLVAKAKALAMLGGKSIAFDFHMIPFYGEEPENKGISRGPHKSGVCLPGFRPHIAWDIEQNMLLALSFYKGAARATTTIKRFFEREILEIFDVDAIEEVYMDSEYTSMDVLEYFVEKSGCDIEVTMCLKTNKKIKNYIQEIEKDNQWEKYSEKYEIASKKFNLERSGKVLHLVAKRRISDKKIRCFGSTKEGLSKHEILEEYRKRWFVENGIKDLVENYFLDQVPGIDPEKIETNFYCVMVARFAVERFIRTTGGFLLKDHNGYRRTLGVIRDLYFTQKNCILKADDKRLLLTFKDHMEPKHQSLLENMWQARSRDDSLCHIPWWGNKKLDINFQSQLN